MLVKTGTFNRYDIVFLSAIAIVIAVCVFLNN